MAENYYYEKLINFLQKREYPLDDTVYLIPYVYIDEENVFPLLFINNNDNIVDFNQNVDYKKGEDIFIYISKCLSKNSLGSLDLTNEFIAENSFIAYKVRKDNNNDTYILDELCNPIIFIHIFMKSEEQIGQTVSLFKENYRIIKNNGNELKLSNLIWVHIYILYCLSVGKNAYLYDEDGEEIEYDVNNGFPVSPLLTDIYKLNYKNFDMPLKNCPKELEVINKIDSFLSESLSEYFINLDGQLFCN
jgi:hypothetical protein